MSDEPEFLPDVDAAAGLRAAFRKDAAAGAVARAKRTEYELQGEIARGGMGVIVKAFDPDLTREVALKVLRDELARAPRFVQRFLEEAQVTARLDHPGIVPVHEAGRDASDRPYFAMRLVRGRELRQILELAQANAQGWSRTRALSVFLKVCEAMAYAHDKGVLHRDLKPSNVMVGEFGEVYVMDWGLARVLGHADAHDMRLREVAAVRGGAEVESPIVTMDGEVLGTPCYMSPEQAQGRIAELDARSDVYSVGAMLYHLLAGEMPYVPSGARVDSHGVLRQLAQGPPRSLQELRRDLPAELIAICERAMARAPEQRYAGMLDMAEDLRAFLEQRVVRAYETGAWAEARKWVRRNRGLAAASAAALLALACGLVASLVLRAQAQEQATLASKRADDVLRLSALQELDDLGAQADRLWPATPEQIPRYVDWLGRARIVVDELPAHEAKLAELRATAVAADPQLTSTARAQHPDMRELELTRRKLEHAREVLVALENPPSEPALAPPEFVFDPTTWPATAQELNLLAWGFVDPERALWGDEAKGLSLAQHALDLSTELPQLQQSQILDTLAWALFANGRYDEALATEERALRMSAGDRVRIVQATLDRLRQAIEDTRGPLRVEKQRARLAALEARAAELEARIEKDTGWVIPDTQDRWWHEQLTKLVERLKAFTEPAHGLVSLGIAPGHGWAIGKRLEFARTIEERSRGGPDAAARWSAALASIRSECPQYQGLELAPQLGLLPIGRDPASGLWEFAHLQTGEPAERGADGQLVLKEDTGLVFVLLPGGVFSMGAQKLDPSAPNYDQRAWPDESPVRAVTLAPFFLSKYEMTQGQWTRMSGANPSLHSRTNYASNWNAAHAVWSALHAVENVSWIECNELLTRLSLALPTEAQWEYACRAGTSSAYWCGDEPESLAGVDNLSDAYGKAHGNDNWTRWEAWLDDGQSVEATVGTYRANGFGLYDLHGNVSEWCRDWYDDYGRRFRPLDGEREAMAGARNKVMRGGSFGAMAIVSRSSHREDIPPSALGPNLGLRPARSVVR